MNKQQEVIDLVENGAEIVRDCLKEETTFRVISGRRVKRFPLDLLGRMKKRGLIIIKDVVGLSAIYKLRRNPDSAAKE